MFEITNARTGRKSSIDPSFVGYVEDRSGDPKYPGTNTILVLKDAKGTFIPCRETYDLIRPHLANMTAAVMRTVDADDPGPEPR